MWVSAACLGCVSAYKKEEKREEKKREEKKRKAKQRREKKRREKFTPFGVDSMRSRVSCRAAQVRVSLPGHNQGQDFGLLQTVCQCM